MSEAISTDELVLYIRKIFHNSTDLFVEETEWRNGPAIICYYTVMTEANQVNEQLELIRQREKDNLPKWGETATSSAYPFSVSLLIESVCSGSAAIIFSDTNVLLKISVPKFGMRAPNEPDNEHVIRGSHEGFVEGFDTNISLIRKRLAIPNLVVQTICLGEDSNTKISYVYIDSIADEDVVEQLKDKLEGIKTKAINSSGQLEDYLEDSVWSPFPQFLNTERPDRVVPNLLEGKIAIFTDHTPTCLVAPVTFFSFYQSPDDFNGRVIVGSFYRIVRLMSFMTAIFLPAFYIAVIGFHSEILPLELSKKVKMAINEIPYRPVVEAFLLELFIELIREASIRLPTPIGQTIGIVGGLVIGDAIVSAGLVSNLMVIVVAMTAISSFVVPSVEMNMTIRIIRFPFMIAASALGFFGIVLGSLVLFIHLMNLSSLKQPYFSPIVPFDPSRFKNLFLRMPYIEPSKQQKSFTHGDDGNGGET
ncbi:spore germination protein [Sporosarcina limicola]|uniref:Spore germination protein KA n=1 Tax=Sporosarcina limicola TaxID=34101 RepID=A0A927MIV7_9BACL|nr:spore germination protein [Sporosarcina limicola]MBE1554743.1 spore germination protein KA [Sporosarcina limicola]